MKREQIETYHLHKAHPEKLQFELYDLGAYRKKSGEKAAIAHAHSYYQIIWFFEEGGYHTIDFKTYDIKKNTVLFIPKGQIHAFDKQLNLKGWLIHFNESFFMQHDADIFLKYHLFSLQHQPCYGINQDTEVAATSYIQLMQKELTHKHLLGHEDVLRYLLKSILILFERVHRKENQSQLALKNHHELLYAKFRALLDENFHKSLSVTSYASLLHISSKTLTHITKTYSGQTASQLIGQRVILEAQRLLKFTSLQVSEIAFRVGVEDPSNFVKYFKRHIGKSPSEFREEIGIQQ